MKFLIIFVFVFLLLGVSTVYADYGITLSKTCINMIKANMTGCPTYEEIMVLFPDTTNQKALGELKITNGVLQRGPSQISHPERYYDYTAAPITWIDPPNDVRKTIKMIIIEPSLPEYKIGIESKQMNDYNISFGKDRHINANCSEIKITAKNWLFLLGDTMNFFNHGCDYSFTNFNGTVSLKFEKSYQDISTSFKWKHDQWVKENLEKCKVKGCK